jgi:hypothetical protein
LMPDRDDLVISLYIDRVEGSQFFLKKTIIIDIVQ